MATPALVRTAVKQPGIDFERFAGVQIDHGSGNNRILLAWVMVDSGDPAIDITSCFAGCASATSQSGGTAMTAVAPSVTNSGARQAARMFYLAGASLPSGVLHVVGDVTYTDRKPGIAVALFDDAGGGPITLSSVTTYQSLGVSHTLNLPSSVVGQVAVAGAYFEEAVALTAPTAWITTPWVMSRPSLAGSTPLQWTNATNNSMGATGFLLSGATGSTSPSITTQPSNQAVTTPATATFTVAATGSGSLTYQWKRNGSNISGATSSTYATPATAVTGGTANNGDVYSVVVTGDTSPPATSNNATLTVNAAITYSVTFGPFALNTGAGQRAPGEVFNWWAFSNVVIGGNIEAATRLSGSGTLNGAGLAVISTLPSVGPWEVQLRFPNDIEPEKGTMRDTLTAA
jgi:hypothetical protein